MVQSPDVLHRLRTLSLIEGTSTLILFGIAMPLKYFADMPMAVRIVGSLHGLLFVMLWVYCLYGIRRIPLAPKLGAAVMIGAIFPFGPFVVDRRLRDLP